MLGSVSGIEHDRPGYAGFGGYARPGSAISVEAETIGEAARGLIEYAERSQALFGEKAAAISQLQELADECAEPDWDGYGARAVNQAAVRTAEDFLRALPDGIPLPEFAPEPDGAISLDWIRSRNRMFSISVGTSNRLAHAWLDGTNKGHAVVWFNGEIIPREILERIRGTMNHGIASFWSC